MKRYLLFAGLNYYPEGGWSDIVDIFDDYEIALLNAQYQITDAGNQWWQIIDTQEKIVYYSNGQQETIHD